MMMHDRHTIPITILICDGDADDRALTRQALEIVALPPSPVRV